MWLGFLFEVRLIKVAHAYSCLEYGQFQVSFKKQRVVSRSMGFGTRYRFVQLALVIGGRILNSMTD